MTGLNYFILIEKSRMVADLLHEVEQNSNVSFCSGSGIVISATIVTNEAIWQIEGFKYFCNFHSENTLVAVYFGLSFSNC